MYDTSRGGRPAPDFPAAEFPLPETFGFSEMSAVARFGEMPVAERFDQIPNA